MPSPMVCRNARCSHRIETADDSTTRCPKCQGELVALPAPEPSATLELTDTPSETLPRPSTGEAPIPFADADLHPAISRYAIRQRLGEGAFGVVYRAYDPRLDREVALKVAKPGTLSTPQRVQRFFREAKAAANLRHPNIVPLFETGRDGDHYFIASAFIPGETLEHHVEEADEKGLPIRDAVRIARKLGEALGYAHSQGIVHRDVKPANVMIDERGEPLLMDFGLAARAEAGEERLTQEGVAMGTPAYMSPEQGRGETERVGPASDQYSLGCTFHEMLTGRTPFSGPAEVQMFLHRTKDPAGVRSLRREVSRDVETICAKSLEKEPGKRYASCQAFADDLRRWQDGEPIAARRLGPVERFARWCRRNPTVAALVSLVVGVTGIGVAVGLYQYGQTSDALAKVSDQQQKTEGALKQVTERFSNAQLLLAEQTWASSEQAQNAVRALNQVPSANRRLEWALARRKYEGTTATLVGHRGAVTCCEESPDGLRLVTGSLDRTARIWDARTGALIHELTGHRSEVWAIRISPRGDRVLTGSRDGTVGIWDGRTGEPIRFLQGHSGEVNQLSLSPEGATLVSGGADGQLIFWDVRTGERTKSIDTRERELTSVRFSPDGASVLFATDGGSVRVVPVAPGVSEFTLQKDSWKITCAEFSPSGRYIVTTRGDGEWFLWDRFRRAKLFSRRGHEKAVRAVAFAPDESEWASVEDGQRLRFWSTATGEPLREQKGLFASVGCLHYSHDGTRLFVGDQEGLRVLRLDALAGGRRLRGHTDKVTAIAISPDSRLLASVTWNLSLRVWDIRSGRTLWEARDHGSSLLCVAFSPNGKQIATGGHDHRIRIWDASSGRLLRKLEGHEMPVQAVAFHPDGKQLISGSADSIARLWELSSGTTVSQFETEEPTHSVAFSPDGHRFSAGGTKLVNLWDAKTGQTLRQLKHHTGPVSGLAFRSDGKQFASASHDGTAWLWDTETGRAILPLIGHRAEVRGVAFSEDGSRVVTGSNDRSVRVWDAGTGQRLLQLDDLPGAVSGVALSKDGRWLAAGFEDHTVGLWDLSEPAEVMTLEGHRSNVLPLVLAPDGKRLISGSSDRTARVWDAESGQLLFELTDHGNPVTAAAVRDDGKIATGALDGTLRLWDGETGTCLLDLDGHHDPNVLIKPMVLALQFSPDGARFASFAVDGATRIWDSETGEEQKTTPPPEWVRFSNGLHPVTPDGRFRWVRGVNNTIQKFPNVMSEDGLARWRHAFDSAPIDFENGMKRTNDPFGFFVHQSLYQRARGKEWLESNHWDKAYLWFVAAEAARPRPKQFAPEPLSAPAEIRD